MEERLGKAPLDADGFVQSFSMKEVEAYLNFFDEYGFVVVRNVLSDDECRATVDEVWRDVEKATSPETPIKRDDPTTWGNDRWPQMQKLGIIGQDPCIGNIALKNRQNPKVYEVFKNILKSEELLVTFDRYGMLRPTKDHEEWKTARSWIHWDLNPWTFLSGTIFFGPANQIQGKMYNRDILKVQGLVSLLDSREEDGGFHTVPKFSKYCFDDWAKQFEGSEHYNNFRYADFVPVPATDTVCVPHLQKIPMRAGSLLIWNSKQPHANYPNDSDRFRMCQYIKMISLDHVQDEELVRDKIGDPQYFLPPNFELSDLGAKLFGLKLWTKANKNCTIS